MANLPVLGILTIYLNDRHLFDERAMFEKMTAAGSRLGIKVFVFTPDDVEESTGRIHALVYNARKRAWSRQWTRFPNVIYDRARYQKSKRFERFLVFRRKHAHLNFINRPLRNKWVIHRTLSNVQAFKAHLPATRAYESPADVAAMLKRFATVYFKPINGTGGRGILRIDRMKDGTLLLQGRNHSRTIVQPRKIRREQLPAVIRGWDRHGDRYIVQQGLQNRLPNGRVHDYRLLVQKNGSGEWVVTGCAGRVGPRNSITSNLHGGGTAASMSALLREWVDDEDQLEQIKRTAESFGIEVAKHLEKTYGTLCELALDLAIDRKGRVWLLEVNHKPAREVFIRAGDLQTYRKAITLPIQFALWMHRQRQGKHAQLPKEPSEGTASSDQPSAKE